MATHQIDGISVRHPSVDRLVELPSSQPPEITLATVRDFVRKIHNGGASWHTIDKCCTILSAIFTTAPSDQIIFLHPCKGVGRAMGPRLSPAAAVLPAAARILASEPWLMTLCRISLPIAWRHAVREIEVKYLLRDPEALMAALKSRSIDLGEPVYQDDQAYAPCGWQFGDSKLGVSFVRLRTVGGRHFFALKQPITNAQSCLEYETEVADRQAMHEAILHMGFYATVRVVKVRRTAAVDALSLCVDDLEGVGTFLELERMAPDDVSAGDAQAELTAFVAGLGVDAQRTEETYDSLVRFTQVASP